VARVYERDGIWYLDHRDVHGKRVRQASEATSKREALAQLHELEARTERQRLGLEPIPTIRVRTKSCVTRWGEPGSCWATGRAAGAMSQRLLKFEAAAGE
jgi:hypothetical protein